MVLGILEDPEFFSVGRLGLIYTHGKTAKVAVCQGGDDNALDQVSMHDKGRLSLSFSFSSAVHVSQVPFGVAVSEGLACFVRSKFWRTSSR